MECAADDQRPVSPRLPGERRRPKRLPRWRSDCRAELAECEVLTPAEH
jgi:hypothetical protein